MRQTSALGIFGENLVAQTLINQGFTILERNYRRFNGEIDIIAHQKELLIFVEVKTRRSSYFDLSLVITPSKQNKIIAAAKLYLTASKDHYTKICRFDVALVQGDPAMPEITYIPNAFMESSY
jgi:putative endonuclease